MNSFSRVLFLIITVLSGLAACRTRTVSSGRPAIAWNDITSEVGALPASMSVYEGRDDETPLHAWYARVSLSSPSVSIHVDASGDDDGKETTSSLSQNSGACLSVNAGYFSVQDKQARHIGLLVIDSELVRSATQGLFRDDKRYEVARAAIGFAHDGSVAIRWVTSQGDSVFAWPKPPRSSSVSDSSVLARSEAAHWPVRHAVAAGPSLLREGKFNITVNEELFDQSAIPNVHPRTAVGITGDGHLILLVVDGRQSESRGVNLNDLAQILLNLGVKEALNLDGGGSSSFVVNGRLLNRPVGGTTEREIVSAISIICHDSVDSNTESSSIPSE